MKEMSLWSTIVQVPEVISLTIFPISISHSYGCSEWNTKKRRTRNFGTKPGVRIKWQISIPETTEKLGPKIQTADRNKMQEHC